MARISVFGLGPVGLVTATCFARKGHTVIGIDTDEDRLEQVRRGRPPFSEPGLLGYLKETVRDRALSVTSDASLNAESDMAFITVGTPSLPDGRIDLKYVGEAAGAIAKSLRRTGHQLIVIKSTVTPGTSRNLVRPILKRHCKAAGRHFSLCSNPEFLREGSAIHDTEFPDRIVIGSDDLAAINRLETFYKEFHQGSTPPIIRTTYENAELIKYANNTLLAAKVSMINCIANIAERLPHADIKVVAHGTGLDQRIGPKFLNAGLGWGGSCFPKDLSALVQLSKSLGYEPRLVEAVIETNKDQWRRAVQLAENELGTLRGKRMAILGLSFKPKTDDMREAVSIPIIKCLLAQGADIIVYDPAAMEKAKAIFGSKIGYASDPIACFEQADCCLIVTEWDQFSKISPSTFASRMRRPVVVDGRRIYDANEFIRAGVKFSAIGLGPTRAFGKSG